MAPAPEDVRVDFDITADPQELWNAIKPIALADPDFIAKLGEGVRPSLLKSVRAMPDLWKPRGR